jgi:hypothetical protein
MSFSIAVSLISVMAASMAMMAAPTVPMTMMKLIACHLGLEGVTSCWTIVACLGSRTPMTMFFIIAVPVVRVMAASMAMMAAPSTRRPVPVTMRLRITCRFVGMMATGCRECWCVFMNAAHYLFPG